MARKSKQKMKLLYLVKIFLEETYSKGVLNGARKIYGQNGELLTQELYSCGTLSHETESSKK